MERVAEFKTAIALNAYYISFLCILIAATESTCLEDIFFNWMRWTVLSSAYEYIIVLNAEFVFPFLLWNNVQRVILI